MELVSQFVLAAYAFTVGGALQGHSAWKNCLKGFLRSSEGDLV